LPRGWPKKSEEAANARQDAGDDRRAVRDLGPGEAVLFPPDAPHQTTMLVDTEVVSVKGVIGGVHKI
jgi:hypothetical protein